MKAQAMVAQTSTDGAGTPSSSGGSTPGSTHAFVPVRAYPLVWCMFVCMMCESSHVFVVVVVGLQASVQWNAGELLEDPNSTKKTVAKVRDSVMTR